VATTAVALVGATAALALAAPGDDGEVARRLGDAFGAALDPEGPAAAFDAHVSVVGVY
jgi:hypothetical protein